MIQNLEKPNYKSWSIDEKNYPSHGTFEDKIKFITNYGKLAPSVHNTQPWDFVFNNKILFIRPKKDVSLPIADSNGSWQYFAIGACVENIDQAANYFGFKVDVKNNQGSVVLKFKEVNPKEDTESLFAIKQRASNKLPYKHKKISESDIIRLQKVKRAKGLGVIIIEKGELFNKIADAQLKAAHATALNKDFVIELAGWLRPNKTRSYDGMPGFITGTRNIKSLVGSRVLKSNPKLFLGAVAQEKSLLNDSSAFLIVIALTNDKNNMIEGGRYVERLWLELIKLDLVAHPMSAMLHDASSAKSLASLIKTSSLPIFFMRIGYPIDQYVRHTPRRLV